MPRHTNYLAAKPRSISVGEKLWQAVREVAKREDRSISSVYTLCATSYLLRYHPDLLLAGEIADVVELKDNP